jgi:hypothetical protein
MCVRSSSVLCVLQFTPFNVVCYVLHRPVSQVIHGQQLSSFVDYLFWEVNTSPRVEEASRLDWAPSPFQQPLRSSSVRRLVGLDTNNSASLTP